MLSAWWSCIMAGRVLVLSLCAALAAGQESPGDVGGGDGVEIGVRILGGEDAHARDVPWHAGIYRRADNSARYDLLCGATLVAPNILITAAHCFWNDHPDINVNRYKVALGKEHLKLTASEPAVQHMIVGGVVLHHRFAGYAEYWQYDLALVKLTTSANMTANVQMAYIDWNMVLQLTLTANTTGVVAGWGLRENSTVHSDTLQSISLPYLKEDSCFSVTPKDQQRMTSGKFCAGFVDENRSVCRGDSGGGYVVTDETSGRNYVIGIVSTNLQPSNYRLFQCYAQFYTTFMDLENRKILQWIRGVFPSDFADVIAQSATATTTPSTRRSTATTTPSPTTSTTTTTTPAPPTFCPAVANSSSIHVTRCHHEDATVSCAEPMLVGSKAVRSCQSGFVSTDHRTTWSITCEGSGSWSDPGLECLPRPADDCGWQDNREIKVYGEPVNTDQPWLVVIYVKRGEQSDWSYRCVGTLITPSHVVTGAERMTYASTNRPFTLSILQLAVGKYIKSFTPVERYTQTRDVRAVTIHEHYDWTTRAHDIALLEAENEFLLSWVAHVACVDWSRQLSPPTTDHLIITAAERRGVTMPSPGMILTTQYHATVTHAQCAAAALENKRRYLQDDHICAITIGNDTVRDISGAGLMVQRTTARGARYFLQGVSSSYMATTSLGGHSQGIVTAYTDLSLHTTWLKQQVDKLNET